MYNGWQDWAAQFKFISPLEKFVLRELDEFSNGRNWDPDDRDSHNGPCVSTSKTPQMAENCNMGVDQFEKIVDRLMGRGLVTTVDGHHFYGYENGPFYQLSYNIDPEWWNKAEGNLRKMVRMRRAAREELLKSLDVAGT